MPKLAKRLRVRFEDCQRFVEKSFSGICTYKANKNNFPFFLHELYEPETRIHLLYGSFELQSRYGACSSIEEHKLQVKDAT
jgi:hypothetical protein